MTSSTRNDDRFPALYGPCALVLGAGLGMGREYALQISELGLEVVLVDRDPDALTEVGRELSTSSRKITADLADPGAVDHVLRSIDDLEVGLVVANAASSHVGAFREQPLSSFDDQIQVNVVAPVHIVHRLLPRLAARERSGIILMSSLSSRRGAPLVATYAATKAFLAILAESLWDELAEEGIDVLGVLPGSTRTPGWLASRPQPSVGTASVMSAEDVVREALRTLGVGGPTLVSGESNRESEAFMDSMSRADAVKLVGQVMRSTYPENRQVDGTI